MSAETEATEWYFGVPFKSKRKAAEAVTAERELKVGGLVRVVSDGWVPSVPKGSSGTVREVLSHGYTAVIDGGDGFAWFFRPDELTLLPPTFAPNTRVRLIRNTQRYAVGDTGTVTLSSDESVGVRMDDGRYWSFKPEDLMVAPAPWGAPDCAERNVEQACWPAKQEAKPKFKVGDVVVTSGVSDAGEGVIEGPSERDDDYYRVKFSTWYGTCAEHVSKLTLVRPAIANDPATPCIIARVDNGRPRPSNYPHVHADAASAAKEAERLASVNPGKQFDVYQRVTGRVAEQHIEMKVA